MLRAAGLSLSLSSLGSFVVTASSVPFEFGNGASLRSLDMEGVQNMLAHFNLKEFLGKSFEQYHIDGEVLRVLQRGDVNEADFPEAKAFHWTKFWSLLDEFRQGDQPLPGASRRLSEYAQKRRAAALKSPETTPGVHIMRDNATISFGVESDSGLYRSGDGEVSIVGRLLVDGTDSSMDVADTLEGLLSDVAAAETNGQVLDALADMVALNTELLINNSNCDDLISTSKPAPAPDVEIYSCSDANDIGLDSGVYETVDGYDVYCNNDISIGGWTLAINIDTGDGNVVDYSNSAFWQSAFQLGGATQDADDALTQDYKNRDVFSSLEVGQILVVVHKEGETLGWRAWDMIDTGSPLSYYFNGGEDYTNKCGPDYGDLSTLSLDSYVPMTLRVFDAEPGDLISAEPIVYSDDCQLFANMDTANTNDYNRLTCAAHPDLDQSGNYGWGLGTLYDALHDASGSNIGTAYCPTNTTRPLCDGQMHTTQNHWGSGGGVGGMIGTDNVCNGGCPWTVESGYNYDYAIYVRASDPTVYESCEDAMADEAASGAYLLSTGEWVYCNNDLSLGGWTLALNIDTSDGNVVDYSNYDFWESSTLLGGAKDFAIHPFEHDYKNINVFSKAEAHEIMVVLHVEGKDTLGYRAWRLYTPGQPLIEYFNTGNNVCGDDSSGSTLNSGKFNYVTSAVIDSWVGSDVIEQEPMVYNDGYQLYANIETGESNDYNRLTSKDHPELTTGSGNYGWGLGTLYDATHDAAGDSLSAAPCPAETMRPMCDAQFHTTIYHWGSNGGLGGMIGTDNVCINDCPWTVESGYAWDYAIYVRTTEPTYYDSCQDVASNGGKSGHYYLSNNEDVYCFVDENKRGWTLALNIDTSDGNVVHYSNVEFWEHDSKLGGAASHHATPFYTDYKNPYVYSEYDASELLIIVHENSVTKLSDSLGWRSWNTSSTQPLRDYFIDNNACGSGIEALDHDLYSTITDGVTGGHVYDLVEQEPIVYYEYELYGNVENGNSYDFNRISGKSSPTAAGGNLGWGLGTMYDASHIDDSEDMCGPDGSSTARPLCDAQFHTDVTHWGSGGGIGGMIGTDNVCNDDCPWTVASGYYYDYAIFVA